MGILPPSEAPTGPASPGRPVCAPGAMSFQCIADRVKFEARIMSVATWFQSLRYDRKVRRANRHRYKASQKPPRRSPFFVPRLEFLEDKSVPSTLTVSNDFDSGAGSLRAVINSAHSGDTIVFSAALAGDTIALSSGELVIAKNLDIQGLGAESLTVSGGDVGRVFHVVNPNARVTISGLTIADGQATQGAGIDNLGRLTVSHCIVSDNFAFGGIGVTALGGGIFNEPGSKLSIDNTTFVNNRAFGGD